MTSTTVESKSVTQEVWSDSEWKIRRGLPAPRRTYTDKLGNKHTGYTIIAGVSRDVYEDMLTARALHKDGYYSESEFDSLRRRIISTYLVVRRERVKWGWVPTIFEDRVHASMRSYQHLTGELNSNA